MIYDQIQNRGHYVHIPLLIEALDFLARLNLSPLPAEPLLSADGRLRFNPVRLRTRTESECLFEAHRQFIDLHYIVSGHERIAVSDVETLECVTAFDEGKDVAFYKGPSEQAFTLGPGDFLYCLPQDAHKVAICAGQPEDVQKIVVKIPV